MKKNKSETLSHAHGEHEKALLRHSYYKVNNRELANDLVQITFLKAWEYLIKHGEINSMRAFLFHLLNNLIIDEYRKKKTVSLDAMTEDGFQIAVDDSERLFNMIDGRAAIMLIPKLSKKYQNVISMRYVDNLSLEEIAFKTNQSRNTVSVQIHRGVVKLAILFQIENSGTSFANSKIDSDA